MWQGGARARMKQEESNAGRGGTSTGGGKPQSAYSLTSCGLPHNPPLTSIFQPAEGLIICQCLPFMNQPQLRCCWRREGKLPHHRRSQRRLGELRLLELQALFPSPRGADQREVHGGRRRG